MSDVAARVETIRPGDLVFTPRGNPDGYPVLRVELHDDGTRSIVYRRYTTGWDGSLGRSWSNAAFAEVALRAMAGDERIRCRRAP